MEKNNLLFTIIAALFSALLFSTTSCSKKSSDIKHMETNDSIEIATDQILSNKILTKEEQEKLTPQQVLDILKQGNEEFISGNLTVRNNTERVRNAALGQYPKAVVLSCLDSRVPVEDIFHQGIGDIFVARVAGNIVNDDILGSMEYACKVSGSKLIVVLGHEYCGAVKSAIDDVKLGNITSLLSKIQPAVKSAKDSYSGNKTSKNPEFVEEVCNHNVRNAIDEIRTKSPILKEMEQKGEIMIVGGIYHMKSGRVDFFHE